MGVPLRLIHSFFTHLLVIILVYHKTEATDGADTCQCGVFLLGSPPLEFSSDAKPVLSGLPVTANCSARDDKISCATICRQLIQAMSVSDDNSPLVQTVVLAATRTLACQRYNESHKVPLPRTILGPDHMTIAKLDETRKAWKFIVGPAARRETEGEQEDDENLETNATDDESSLVGKLSEPKWLGGFYRWCDSHWVYAGVSLQEPLCCMRHMPKKCPSSRREEGRNLPEPEIDGKNGRQPRLIIKKRPEDDLSSEEQDLQPLEDVTGTTSAEVTSKIPPTTSTLGDSSSETETPYGNSSAEYYTFDNMDIHDMKIDAETPHKRKPLNSTVLAEAFQFVGALMRSLGFGEVADGIGHVLPATTASELLERVDVGGWVGTYQDKYVIWSREFNLGYCYVEYSLYNMANDGFVASTSNLIARLFKSNPQPPPMNNHVNNYISPMTSMADGFKSAFHGHMGAGPGNRRVRRAEPNVFVSRSYSSISGQRSRVSKQTQGRPTLEQLSHIARIETAMPMRPSQPIPATPVDRMQTRAEPTQPQHLISPQQVIASNPATTENIGESRMSTPSQSQGQKHRRPQQEKAHNQAHHKVKSSGKDASTGQLMNLASALMQTAMGGSEVDKVSMIMQNALPLVSQVATSPMIQGMVSNLVTSFLTPPRAPPPPPVNKGGQQGPTGPSSSSNSNFSGPGPARKPAREPVESNEINEPPVLSSSKPTQSSNNPLFSFIDDSPSGPSGGGGGGGGGGANGGIATMLTQIVQTYLKHYFTTLDSRPPQRPAPMRPQKVSPTSSASSSSSSSNSGSSSSHQDEKIGVGGGEGGGDIVAMISEVAKPFFISYFGVVPDVHGFGQLSISERRAGNGKDSSAYLTNDPDPGTGITDLLLGSPNLPETGNPVFDFGNRVAYAFSKANDPMQGLYCFKQYAVNKMWDYFRVGVKTLFK